MSGGWYFISDAHIRQRDSPDERAKQEHLRSFLSHLHGRAERLFVVGDLFDYWFEYASVVPRRGGRVLAALADLVDDGVPVVVFGGNHDWWVGPSLAEEYGIQVHHGPLWLEAGGKRLYVHHGDGLSVSNRRYRLVRRILHHPCAIRAFASLHPDWGAWMARLVSRASSRADAAEKCAAQRVPVFEAIANKVFAEGADIAVFGHVHVARIEARRDGLLVVLGDWISLGTYGELTDGVFHLRTWRAPDLPPWPAS